MKRVFAFPLVRLLLILLLFGALITPIVLAIHPRHGPWRSAAMTWVIAALLLAAMVAVERFAAQRPPSAIGLNPRNAVRDLSLGILLGAALFSAVVLELAIGGYYRVVAVHITPDLGVAALLFLADAVVEELLFRGVIFRLVEEWSGTWIALAVSAAIFGFAHAANPHATLVSSLAIALEAGVLLGAAFVLTRNLWFPIGLHFAWNFTEGPIFGTQVSGHSFFTSALGAHIAGPVIVTGGSFGPEAGVAAIVTSVMVAVALLRATARRGRIKDPAWIPTAFPKRGAPWAESDRRGYP